MTCLKSLLKYGIVLMFARGLLIQAQSLSTTPAEVFESEPVTLILNFESRTDHVSTWLENMTTVGYVYFNNSQCNIYELLSNTQLYDVSCNSTDVSITIKNTTRTMNGNVWRAYLKGVQYQTNIFVKDRELLNLPRDLYVAKLLRLTNESESDLLSYRDLLSRRARPLENCPSGRLITRRGSRKESVCVKLATDCYIIDYFIKGGGGSEIEALFTKIKQQPVTDCNTPNKESENKHNSIEFQIEFSKILTNMIDLNKKYTEIKQEQCNYKEQITTLNLEIRRLSEENLKLYEKVNLFTQQYGELLSQNNEKINFIMTNVVKDAAGKAQQVDTRANCDQYDTNKFIATKHKEETELKITEPAHVDPTITLTNHVTEIPITDRSSKYKEHEMDSNSNHLPVHEAAYDNTPSYADVLKINQKATDNANSNQVVKSLMIQDPETKRWTRSNSNKKIAEDSSKTNVSKKNNSVGNKIETVPITNRETKLRNELTSDSKAFKATSKVVQPTERSLKFNVKRTNIFKGQYIGRVKRYYVGGINPDSTDGGLEEYLTERGINPTELSLFESKRGNLCAKITIPYYEAYIIEDSEFWPRFMRCRQWRTKNMWNQRQTADYSHYDSHDRYDSYNNGSHENISYARDNYKYGDVE